MIENQFIPYEQALKLKQLGFDELCLLNIQYSSGTDIFTKQKYENSIWLGNGYDAEISGKKIEYEFPKHSEQKWGKLQIPLWQQVFDWFREKHNLEFENTISCIDLNEIKNKKRYNIFIIKSNESIVGLRNKCIFNMLDFETYEEAKLECLKKLIEIVKSK